MNLFTFLKKQHVFQHIMVIFAFIFLIPCFASAYSVSYEYDVYAYVTRDFPINERIVGEEILEGVSSTSGSITQTGSPGNYATIQYYADLTTGSIGAYAYAESDQFYASGRVEKIGFSDTLTFFVPKGYYADDLTVTLSGAITGTLSATALSPLAIAHAKAGYSISFAGGDSLSSLYYAETTQVIYDPFYLTRTLVSGGTTLTEDKYYSYDLTAYFNSSATTPNQWYAPYYYAEAEVDFYNTLRFTDVGVSDDGVTWTSESGVFLSNVSVPEPATVLLVAFGLLGLVSLRKRLVNMN